MFKQKVRHACAGKKKITGTVRVYIRLHWQTKRRRDLDNFFKALFDATKDILFEDDDKVIEIIARKDIGQKTKPDGFEMAVVPCE